MPVIGMITGGVDFTQLTAKVGDATVNYGTFIQNIIDFLIIAFCIFLMIKGMNKLSKKKEEEPAPEPEPSAEEKLLGEIRDLLKNK
jgi:large conductance mechanosensitive channel